MSGSPSPDLALGDDEVIVWAQGDPFDPAAYVCDRQGGFLRYRVPDEVLQALSAGRRLLALGTPEQAGVPVQSRYQAFVYALKPRERD